MGIASNIAARVVLFLLSSDAIKIIATAINVLTRYNIFFKIQKIMKDSINE
jgi:hypothetical protein